MTWKKSKQAALLALAAITLPAENCRAQGPAHDSVASRPVESIYRLETGGARVLSTYLSPLYYDGIDFALSGTWTKAFNHWPDRCTMRFEAGIDVQSLLNPAKSAQMLTATARFNWGLLWRHDTGRWRVNVGPMLDMYGGALYSLRNGNNPVTALGSAGIDIAASAAWRFRIGRYEAAVTDEVRVPTLSAFFSPGYGETYYEIWLGNHSDLVHCGWWGNAFGIDNLLSLRIDFGRAGLEVGYRLDLRTFGAGGLETSLLRNCAVIGGVF